MAELDENAHSGSMTEALEESEDVRRIKEEWTRMQVEADGDEEDFSPRPGDASERAEMNKDNRRADFLANRGKSVTEGNGGVKKMPPSRLPSLDSMVGRMPSIPSMEISSSFGQKLPDVGSVGQRLGILGDSKELEPQTLVLEKLSYTFGADTPTQTDIKWSPPGNAHIYKSLSYNVEVDGGQGWVTLTDGRLPILRAYFTSEKLIMGRFSKVQEAEPVAVRLRVRATGTVRRRDQEESISGPWSEEIWLSIEGSTVTSNTAV